MGAFTVALCLTALVSGVIVFSLRLIVGPEWYAGEWSISSQLAFAQTIGTLATVGLAGGFGWYAVEQLRVGQSSYEQTRALQSAEGEEQRRRLLAGLAALSHSLEHNRAALQQIARVLNGNRSLFESRLDITAWDAMNHEITPFLEDGALAGRLALHFGRINTFSNLLELYLQYSVGMLSTLQGTNDTRVDLRRYLIRSAAELEQECVHMTALVAAAIGART